MDYQFISSSVEQTMELGRQIGRQLKGGEIIGLVGPLGSGKTYFIKGLATGAGAVSDPKLVNSPSFVIVNIYNGFLDIYHIDAFRINSLKEFQMVGFDDFCLPSSVVVIEWADKVEKALAGTGYVRIQMAYLGRTQRKITMTNVPNYFKLDS
jgi:tRNA threonylcarbamoyladenosine biosynthesis protein TsaE